MKAHGTAQLHILLMTRLRITETRISLQPHIQIKSLLTHLIGRFYLLKVIRGLQVLPDQLGLRDLQEQMDLQDLQGR